MALPEGIQICLEGLLKKHQVSSWSIFTLRNGQINVSIKLDNGTPDQLPETISYKRINDKQRLRNQQRAENHKKKPQRNTENDHFTRSEATGRTEDKESEVPRYQVDNVCHRSVSCGSLSPIVPSTDHGLIINNSLCSDQDTCHDLTVELSLNEEVIREETPPKLAPMEVETETEATNDNAIIPDASSDKKQNAPKLSFSVSKVSKCFYKDSRPDVVHYNTYYSIFKCCRCETIVCASCMNYHADNPTPRNFKFRTCGYSYAEV